MQSAIKLYTYFRSSTAQRVRIVLNLKGIKYEPIYVNLLKGEQKEESYTKVNPNKAVPALDVGGTILIETMAICEYLEETYPDTRPLLPKDPIKKAQIRAFCEVINSAIHPYQNLRNLKHVEELTPGYDKVAFVQTALKRGFETLEQLLKQHHGKYCFGDEITLADAFLVPQVGGAIARFQVDIDVYPILKEVYLNLKDIEEFKTAQPDQQPDFK